MLTYDHFTAPIGHITVVKSAQGVCFIGLPSTTLKQVEVWARRHIPGESLTSSPEPFERERRELQEYFNGRRSEFTFPLDRRGTPFSHKVLEAVHRVPYGETTTYGQIARRIGRPRAARAVGRTVAANPLPLVIPCHRIVGTGGALTGFGGGLPLKEQLLQLEAGGA